MLQVTLKELLEQKKVALKMKVDKTSSIRNNLGSHLSNAKGSGMTFAEVREYLAGDDVRSIDWKVTARTGTAYTKLFVEEHERPVNVLVDYSESMQFGTKKTFKSVVAAKKMALIAWSCGFYKDPVSLTMFADDKFSYYKGATDNKVYGLFHQLINPSWQKEASFSKCLQYCWNLNSPGSLIYIVSDFLKLDAEAKKIITTLRQRFNFCFVFVSDKIERELPPNDILTFTDGSGTHKISTYDKSVCDKYRQAFLSRFNDLQNFCFKNQIPLISVDTNG